MRGIVLSRNGNGGVLIWRSGTRQYEEVKWPRQLLAHREASHHHKAENVAYFMPKAHKQCMSRISW